MIRQEIALSLIPWHISILYNCKKEDTIKVSELLQSLKASKLILHLMQQVLSTATNVGFTYCNFLEKCSLIMLSEGTSDLEIINTLSHEIVHLAWQISLIYNIKEEETLATIIGNLSEEIYKVAKVILYSVNKDKFVNY